MKVFIAIELGGKIYSPLLIGYIKDGGFFLSDLFPSQSPAYISKIKILLNTPGRSRAKVDRNNQWISQYNPKLTHHSDGNAHVSKTSKIISGFYKLTGKAKGVHVNSMDLFRNDNDGGPLFTFLFWGEENFDFGRSDKETQVVFKENEIRPALLQDGPYQGYYFEGYYISKALKGMIDQETQTFIKPHPNFGDLELKIVPTADNTPGYIGLACFRSTHGFKEKSGCVIVGGPGRADSNGYFENISIIRPAIKEFIKKDPPRSIDLTRLTHLFFKLDLRIATRVNFLKKHVKETISTIMSQFRKLLPVSIFNIRTKLYLKRGYFNEKRLLRMFSYIKPILATSNTTDYRTLRFYVFWLLEKQPSIEIIENTFKDLSGQINYPLRSNPRRSVEQRVSEVCSLDKLKEDFTSFISINNLPSLRQNSWLSIKRALKSRLKTHPITVQGIPNALPGTNIKYFSVSHFSYMMVPYPDVLYSRVYLFSSHDYAPLSLVVEGSMPDVPMPPQ